MYGTWFRCLLWSPSTLASDFEEPYDEHRDGHYDDHYDDDGDAEWEGAGSGYHGDDDDFDLHEDEGDNNMFDEEPDAGGLLSGFRKVASFLWRKMFGKKHIPGGKCRTLPRLFL